MANKDYGYKFFLVKTNSGRFDPRRSPRRKIDELRQKIVGSKLFLVVVVSFVR